MNYVCLKGNLGQDPEVKQLPSEKKVCKFSLATSESYTNREGERVTNTDWHNIIFYGPVCDVIRERFHKGDQIIVTGKIKYRSYENKDGQTVHVTEIICNNFEFCGTAKKENPATNQDDWKKGEKREVQSMSNADDLPGYIDTGNVPDDQMSDLPF